MSGLFPRPFVHLHGPFEDPTLVVGQMLRRQRDEIVEISVPAIDATVLIHGFRADDDSLLTYRHSGSGRGDNLGLTALPGFSFSPDGEEWESLEARLTANMRKALAQNLPYPRAPAPLIGQKVLVMQAGPRTQPEPVEIIGLTITGSGVTRIFVSGDFFGRPAFALERHGLDMRFDWSLRFADDDPERPHRRSWVPIRPPFAQS